jgi:hypothetical protein
VPYVCSAEWIFNSGCSYVRTFSRCERIIQSPQFYGSGKNSNEIVCVAISHWVGKHTIGVFSLKINWMTWHSIQSKFQEVIGLYGPYVRKLSSSRRLSKHLPRRTTGVQSNRPWDQLGLCRQVVSRTGCQWFFVPIPVFFKSFMVNFNWLCKQNKQYLSTDIYYASCESKVDQICLVSRAIASTNEACVEAGWHLEAIM